MQSDRELLEAAAKAAGFVMTWEGDNPPYPRARQGRYNPSWNPLEDDADAFRLAVKLELRVAPPWHTGGYQRARADHIPTGKQGAWTEDIPDPYAATRRAIVRAAAELSKQGA
jgi:hypothetical protein